VATRTDKPRMLKKLEDHATRREFFLTAAQKLRRRLRAGVPAGGGADGFKVPPVTHDIAAKVTAEALERLFPPGTTEGHCHLCGAHGSSLTAQLLSRAATADDAKLALVACCRRCACDVRGGRNRVPRQPTVVPRRTTYSVWRRSLMAVYAGRKVPCQMCPSDPRGPMCYPRGARTLAIRPPDCEGRGASMLSTPVSSEGSNDAEYPSVRYISGHLRGSDDAGLSPGNWRDLNRHMSRGQEV
jgi:hypothetical protein